ncbi:alpha/beta hydrolase [Undibacterium sp. Di27W]|uniref:alpha/beta hydrolase n=1 Tax=Undibacterium sp. Di27W TaxID=3413036 RepID=UPI003BF1712F
MKKYLSGLLIALLVVGCGGGSGGTSANSNAVGIPADVALTKSSTFLSKSTGVLYPINVYVPADYARTSDALPVIFTLDGELSGGPFEVMRRILMDEGTRVILVGVATAGKRDFDYLLPGATDFYKFLSNELVPSIEVDYRVNSKQRTLVGHSFGADFVQTALTLDRPDKRVFRNFIAVDGPLRNPVENAQLDNAMFLASAGKMPDTTFVYASAGGAGFDSDVEAAYQKMLARNYQGLNLIRLPAYKTDHGGVFTPAITDVLHLLFKK